MTRVFLGLPGSVKKVHFGCWVEILLRDRNFGLLGEQPLGSTRESIEACMCGVILVVAYRTYESV